MTFKQIKMAIYATYLTNKFGLKLKYTPEPAEKRRLRIAYSETLLNALNITVKVTGKENIPANGQCLLLSNHRSVIDPLIIENAIKESGIFGLWVAKKELYNSFFFGLFTRNAGTILLDREADRMSSFFKEIKMQVSAGHSIFLFPEGTRNKSGEPLSGFKEGARIIALKNRLDMLPLFIRTNANQVLMQSLENADEPLVIEVEIGRVIDCKERAVSVEMAYRERFGLNLAPQQ